VLVADDDRDFRTMLRTLLELDGHKVMEAKDGDPRGAKKAGCDEYVLKTDPLPGLRDKVRQYANARTGPPAL